MALTKAHNRMIEGQPINALDYMTAAQVADVTSGTGSIDVTNALQSALTVAATSPRQALYLPAGKYLVSGSITENSNGGATTVFGDGKHKTFIQVAAGTTNTRIWDLGTTTGHGAYRLYMYDFAIYGNDRTDGNTAIYCPEGGISHIHDLQIRFFEYGIHGAAWTGSLIDGKMEIYGCTHGIYLPRGGGNNSPSNIAVVKDAWISGCDQAIFIEGGAPEISGVTLQSCGLSGTQHLIHCYDVYSSGSAAKFAGAKVHGIWCEGGEYKYVICIDGLRNSAVHDNHLIGSGSANGNAEGGILLINAPASVVTRNSVYNFWDRTPQDGRLDNAAIYVDSSSTVSNARTWNVYDNRLTKTQTGNQYYFAGEPNPTISRDINRFAYAYVSISGGTATVENGKNVRSVSNPSTGSYTVTLEYNRDSADTAVLVTPHKSSGDVFAVVNNNGAQTIGIRFYNSSGTLIDPDGFSIKAFGSVNTI